MEPEDSSSPSRHRRSHNTRHRASAKSASAASNDPPIFDVSHTFFDECRMVLQDLEQPATASSSSHSAVLKSSTDSATFNENNATRHRSADVPVDGEGATCILCGVAFASVAEQRAHFKSDWHRLNLKRSSGDKPQSPLSEEEFEQLVSGVVDIDIDLSDSSGDDDDEEDLYERDDASDDEQDDDGSDDYERLLGKELVEQARNPRLFFYDKDRKLFYVWKCILASRAELRDALNAAASARSTGEPSSLSTMLRSRLCKLPFTHPTWAIVLCGGGHFAAAIINSSGVLAHKCFHRYIVRKKAGGRQSSHDKASGPAKSAGAGIRRHNERALETEIRTLLSVQWKTMLASTSAIFLHAPGHANTTTFFGGGGGGSDADVPFSRSDPRIRKIPFVTGRPTFTEAKRVYSQLSRLHYTGDVVPLPPAPEPTIETETATATSTTSTTTPTPSEPAATEPEPSTPEDEAFVALCADLYSACKQGDRAKVKILLQSSNANRELGGSDQLVDCINLPVGRAAEGGWTSLFCAAFSGNGGLVKDLLAARADPTVHDLRNRTAYLVASSKPARDAFRRFMGENPDAYDWSLTAIPSALTSEMEKSKAQKEAEKRKRKKEKRKQEAQELAQREREAADAAQREQAAAAQRAEQYRLERERLEAEFRAQQAQAAAEAEARRQELRLQEQERLRRQQEADAQFRAMQHAAHFSFGGGGSGSGLFGSPGFGTK